MSIAEDTIRFVDIIKDKDDLKTKVLDNMPVKFNIKTLTMSEEEFIETLYNYLYLKYATWEVNYDTPEAFLRAFILLISSSIQALIVRLKWVEADFITQLQPEQLLGMGYSHEVTDQIAAALPPMHEMLVDDKTEINYNTGKSNQTFQRIVDYKDGFKSIKEAMVTPIGNGISEWFTQFDDLFISVYSDRRIYE